MLFIILELYFNFLRSKKKALLQGKNKRIFNKQASSWAIQPKKIFLLFQAGRR